MAKEELENIQQQYKKRFEFLSEGSRKDCTRMFCRICKDVTLLKQLWDTCVQKLEQSSHIKGEYDRIFKATYTKNPILLCGEPGCGKTHLAKIIFRIKTFFFEMAPTDGKTWADRFQEVNCAELRGNILLSRLFGHKKGAFTGATADKEGIFKIADGGVLFLDEIGELHIETQAILLKVIEQKQFTRQGDDTKTMDTDFHLICGTNRNLEQMVSEGTFRADLYSRIGYYKFDLPNLSAYLEDNQFKHILTSVIELIKDSDNTLQRIEFATDAQEAFKNRAPSIKWRYNYRTFRNAVTQMFDEAYIQSSSEISQKIVTDVLDKIEQGETNAQNTAKISGVQNQDIPVNSDNDAKVKEIIQQLLKDKTNVKRIINDLTIIFPSSDWKKWIEIIPHTNDNNLDIDYIDLVKLIYILHLIKGERITKYHSVANLEKILGTSGNLNSNFLIKFGLKVIVEGGKWSVEKKSET